MVKPTLEGYYCGFDSQGNSIRVSVYRTGETLELRRQGFDDHPVHPGSNAQREIEIVYGLTDLKWVNRENFGSAVEANI